ncbi:hypothetical protein M427DRAFT_226169 [Gonapodya prolifera JEL478]|uniref:Helicase C-terminal domain-containing protein n=1 Tax=Gonapodya prolifera (strain JEL478) TaxID=1344416 RepID=A0A139ANF7_GONPJ|nr:hypothetical protein M427DRAFT_226169 [Gonapodya prolifera JEL478]|eukprot:KXS18279.1 hypothetical protein M427DRAFT_226169 [Gonapodya prolifera JEL478]
MHNWVFEALTRNGVVSVNFNTPSLERRRQALDAIKTDPKVRVILVSLKSREGAAGLTLTCCTAVYLLEPIMNPGLEAQAIGRVNRIGQTRETTVIRLVMSGTIEETILKYAESKKMNASNQIPQGDGAAGSSFESSKAQPFDFFLGEKEEFQTGQVLEMFGLTMEELKMARRREGGRNEGDEESDGDNESDEEDESDPESERAQESESDSDA